MCVWMVGWVGGGPVRRRALRGGRERPRGSRAPGHPTDSPNGRRAAPPLPQQRPGGLPCLHQRASGGRDGRREGGIDARRESARAGWSTVAAGRRGLTVGAGGGVREEELAGEAAVGSRQCHAVAHEALECLASAALARQTHAAEKSSSCAGMPLRFHHRSPSRSSCWCRGWCHPCTAASSQWAGRCYGLGGLLVRG